MVWGDNSKKEVSNFAANNILKKSFRLVWKLVTFQKDFRKMNCVKARSESPMACQKGRMIWPPPGKLNWDQFELLGDIMEMDWSGPGCRLVEPCIVSCCTSSFTEGTGVYTILEGIFHIGGSSNFQSEKHWIDIKTRCKSSLKQHILTEEQLTLNFFNNCCLEMTNSLFFK